MKHRKLLCLLILLLISTVPLSVLAKEQSCRVHVYVGDSSPIEDSDEVDIIEVSPTPTSTVRPHDITFPDIKVTPIPDIKVTPTPGIVTVTPKPTPDIAYDVEVVYTISLHILSVERDCACQNVLLVLLALLVVSQLISYFDKERFT